MRILKQGKIPEEKWRGTCSRCQTEFEADKHEVRFERDGQRGAHIADCPTCGQSVWMQEVKHA